LYKDLQQDLNTINKWMFHNSLSIQSNKCKVMSIGCTSLTICNKKNIQLHNHDHHSPNICICPNIEYTESFKYLGIEIDNNLKWNNHTLNLVKKLMKYLFTFKNINKYLDNKHSKMIYYTFIQSILSYGIEIWGKCYNTHLIDLKRLIKKLQKNLGLTNDKSILSIDQLYLYRLITSFHDYIKTHPITTVASRYNLRNKSIPRILPKTETVKRQILYTEPTIYSKLPNIIKQIENPRSFKKNVYQFLLNDKHSNF